MPEFQKRPEVTVETMGKVHNPTGEGVRATSSEVQRKALRLQERQFGEAVETKIKEEGSSRRNITRKKTSVTNGGNYDSSSKKMGGAGKGKWDPLDGADSERIELDKDDPLYDDMAEEGKYVLTSADASDVATHINKGDDPTDYDEIGQRNVYGPMLTLSEFKHQVCDTVREYFDSGDADEVLRGINELKCREYHAEVVKRAVSLSLDQGPREREMISRLLTSLHPNPLSDDDMENGFVRLLDSLDDLSVDIPDARAIVGCFLARAVVDEVLPPAFLSNRNNSHPGDEVVEKAVGLLSKEHCTARLEHVWGPGDGRPVAELKKVMDQALEEYLLSRELDEAARCVRELGASHFHHELVKRGVKIAMEKDGMDHMDNCATSSLDAMAALFSFLVKNSIVSEYQVAKGIARLRRLLTDLKLDVPAAPAMLDEFEEMAREGGCLPGAAAIEASD